MDTRRYNQQIVLLISVASAGPASMNCTSVRMYECTNLQTATERDLFTIEIAAEHGCIDTLQLLLGNGAGTDNTGPIQYKRALRLTTRNGYETVLETTRTFSMSVQYRD